MRNKLLLIILLCLGTAFGAQAQKKKKDKDDKKKGLKVGIRAGINRSGIAFKDDGNVDLEASAKAAINGGIFFRYYMLGGRVIIQPEMIYSRQGFTYDSTLLATSGDERVNARLSFFNIPLNIVVRPSKKFSINLGPSFGYMMRAIQEGKDGNVEKEDIIDLMNRAELAMNIGVGFRVLKIFRLGVTYKRGLTPITKGELDAAKENPLEAVELVNQLFDFNVGLNLPNKWDKLSSRGFDKDGPINAYNHFKEKRAFLKKQY